MSRANWLPTTGKETELFIASCRKGEMPNPTAFGLPVSRKKRKQMAMDCENPSLGDALQIFQDEKRGKKWSSESDIRFESAKEILAHVISMDTRLANVKRSHFVNFREILQKLPTHRNKRAVTRGKTISETMRIAKAEDFPFLRIKQ